MFLSLLCLSTAAATAEDDSGKSSSNNYYEIYEAIDTLNELAPGHRTFYDFLGVSPDALDDDVSRAFRKAAVQYHPDKLRLQGRWNRSTERMSKTVQFIGSLLRTDEGRRQYDWILNEAPAWHRQSVYVMRRLVPTSKLSIPQVLLITLLFSVLLQLVAQWIGYAAAWYMIISSRWAVRAMGEKEVKRMKKRMEGSDPAFIAMSNTNYHAIMLAEGAPPRLPNPLSLWVFALPMGLARRLLGTVLPTNTKTVKRE